MSPGSATPRPTPLDILDLWLLRLAHWRRERIDATPAGYDSYFAKHDTDKYAGDVRNAWRYGVMRQMADRCLPAGEGVIADVGAGLGVAQRYLPDAARIVAVEYSRTTQTMAQGLGTQARVDHVQGAFPALPLASGSVDFCVCMEVVEHLEDDRAGIAELARVVRPGGHLLISVPRTFYWPDYLPLMGHYRHYTGAGLAALLRDAGLQPVAGLSQFTRTWRWYHYAYVGARAVEALVHRLGAPEFSLYEARPYRWLAARLLGAMKRRQRTNDVDSTYILARRVEAMP